MKQFLDLRRARCSVRHLRREMIDFTTELVAIAESPPGAAYPGCVRAA